MTTHFAQERNQDSTVWVGELDSQVTEALLWELMLQAGPVVNVHIPRDKLSGQHSGYGFVEYHTEEDADYAIKIMNMIKVFGKVIRVNKAQRDKKQLGVGANLFIGNLDPEVDEKLLYDTFSAFGVIIATPKIMKDPESGVSKGFGFISYDSFEASDLAIECMNGQQLANRAVSVSYALKKDSKGERHGAPSERLLAAGNSNRISARPHQFFGTGPSAPPMANPMEFPAAGFAPPFPFAPFGRPMGQPPMAGGAPMFPPGGFPPMGGAPFNPQMFPPGAPPMGAGGPPMGMPPMGGIPPMAGGPMMNPPM